MNADQTQIMEGISRNIIECWTRIKKKARDEGRGETNIEKHAPCITGALNSMERFLAVMDEDNARVANRQGEMPMADQEGIG